MHWMGSSRSHPSACPWEKPSHRSAGNRGEGSIFWSEEENCWVGEITLPDGTKRRKRNKKQSVVRSWLHEQLEAIKTNTVTLPSNYTVKTYFDLYFETVGATLRPKTITAYKWLAGKHIYPEIGNIKLISLTATRLDQLYALKRKDGLSERTIEYIHALIRLVLNHAVKKNILVKNPTVTADAPKPGKKYVQPLTVEEVHRLFEAIKYDRLRNLWIVGVGTGLRLGELLALTWDCIDWENEVLYVRQSFSEVRGKGMVLGTPKSEKSYRTVGLPNFVLEALRDQRLASSAQWVFSTSHSTPFSHRNVLREFKKVSEKANLSSKIRIHDLRHTFISHLLAENVPPRDVQEIAGHSSFAVTMDIYGHLLPGAQREAAKKNR